MNNIGVFLEVDMRHISKGGDSDQDNHHGRKTGAPCSQETAHFLLMRIGGGGIVSLRTAPCHTIEDGTENTDKHIEQIECTQIFNIIRIQHTFPGSTIHQRRHHFAVP